MIFDKFFGGRERVQGTSILQTLTFLQGGQLFFDVRQRKVAKENEPESRGKGVAALLIFPCSLDS